MPLRQLQVHVPASRGEELDRFFGEKELVPLWRGTDDPGWGVLAIIVVDAYETDALVHELLNRFEGEEHLKLVVFEATACYPRPGTEEEDEEKQGEAEGKNGEEPESEEKKSSPARIAIGELEERLHSSAQFNNTYCTMVMLSALVAALGLIRNNTAVVIGAMVIAPLLGPNMALALGTTLGQLNLVKRALLTNGAGVIMAFLFALLLGVVMHVDPSTPEIASRTDVRYSDLALALAAGVAGALAFTTGVPAALVGVMVAVALIPPLVSAGLLLGAGYPIAGFSAALLTVINVIAVNLAAVLTFAAKGIKPRRYWEAASASRMTRRAIAIWVALLALLVVLVWFAGQHG